MSVNELSLEPYRLDLKKVPAGDDISLILNFSQEEAPLDTTNAVVSCQVRQSPTSEDIEITATCTPVDAANGIWSVVFNGNDTRTLLDDDRRWSGWYDIEITQDGQTNPRTVMHGRFLLHSDVTRV